MYYPATPHIREMKIQYGDLEIPGLYLKAPEKHHSKRDTLYKDMEKIYGKVMSICDENLHDRLFRLPDFAEVL